MKRIRKLIKENKKLLFGVIIGVILTSTTVYAVQAIATSITYDNTTSGLQATNVQDAVDELYTKANSDSFWLKKYKTFAATPQYYAYGTYKGWCSSTDTNCNSYADFPTTETTPPSGKNVYAAKYADGQYGVCIKRNGTEHCFRARNYTAESKHLQEVFSDGSCNVYSSSVGCKASDFNCSVSSTGYVSCKDYGARATCNVNDDGSVRWYE